MCGFQVSKNLAGSRSVFVFGMKTSKQKNFFFQKEGEY